MTQKPYLLGKKASPSTGHWWIRFVAIIALVNFTLVVFNETYIFFRHFYLKYIPAVVSVYDPVKSILPDAQINHYLNQVDRLAAEINTQGLEEAATEKLLQNLRQESLIILDDPSFLISNQIGILAKIKREIQAHTDTPSVRNSFRTPANLAFSKFWRAENLAQLGTEKELDFFNEQIRPLLHKTYFRALNEQGQLEDNFWKIDRWFMIFFALEFLRKTILRKSSIQSRGLGKFC